jgi:hypothetical protein
MTMPDLNTPDGRRAGAFLALLGGAIVNTVFAAVFIYLLRDKAGFLFWLALCHQALTLVCLTGLSALLVKRSIKITREGAEFNDQAEAAQFVADKAQAGADEVKA